MELKSRIRAILRRVANPMSREGITRLVAGKIVIDTERRQAWFDGKEVILTAKEFDLMEFLMRNEGKVYTRENLLKFVWDYAHPDDARTVDVHICRLREKLEDNPAKPQHISTKRGVGYYFKA